MCMGMHLRITKLVINNCCCWSSAVVSGVELSPAAHEIQKVEFHIKYKSILHFEISI
jgi:hypothetical protein